MQGCSKTETCHAGRRPKNQTFGFGGYKSGVPMQSLYITFYEIPHWLLAVSKLNSIVAWSVYGRSEVSRRGCTVSRSHLSNHTPANKCTVYKRNRRLSELKSLTGSAM
ncbi:hypothetical protein COCC4DRAFT_60353 [Bipolaris maydis ATCC 48331]|uniref:Uncharacterized protein n=1 Tax=Cochliobolus heterostrophus (strain C4 / ATCC 48331 / race T) TaxID=665024 RepID=N4WZH4_COCH4|nr:uncharacterized protein COCC4DRAFT_60353 [Bipolaris maydis ATCC 48331]ENI06089.1 hypothetical protein COCC4DRAFT_60353 [Bipolaris maydis ATCC 48331]